jgi:dTDP-4-amino-4,6-dideoxygalactose transaminase
MILTDRGAAPTPEILRGVEDDLLTQTGGSAALFCGRAATALYLAYRLATKPGERDAEVIMPAMSCSTPANTALLASCQPRFADVDAHTGLATLESIQARATPRTRAVVFIHLYGQTADLEPLAGWCRARNILLIEDTAQALGARLPDGRHVGAAGDLCVYSFCATKILECGGGAITVPAPQVERLRHLLAEPLPAQSPPDEAAQLSLSYRNLHHGLVGLLRLHPELRIADFFAGIRPRFDGLYVRPMTKPEALAEAWKGLDAGLAHRRALAERYAQALTGGPWKLLEGWRASGVCWRFTLLLETPGRLVSFCEAVRRDGNHVSNLYWPPHCFFRPDDDCPRALAFGRRVVNLWVDAQTSPEAVDRCAASLQRHAKALAFGIAEPRP